MSIWESMLDGFPLETKCVSILEGNKTTKMGNTLTFMRFSIMIAYLVFRLPRRTVISLSSGAVA